jgi:hypothetical protein
MVRQRQHAKAASTWAATQEAACDTSERAAGQPGAAPHVNNAFRFGGEDSRCCRGQALKLSVVEHLAERVA